MPEEEKTALESKGKLVKEIYIDRQVVDRLWIEDSKSYYGKPERGMLGTLIFNDCCHEKLILLMGSECSTEDLMMEGEMFEDASDGIPFDYHDHVAQSVILKEQLNAGDFDMKVVGGKNQQQGNKFSESANKEAEVTNPMAESGNDKSKSQEQEDGKLLNENMVMFGREVPESINGIQQFTGGPPYSGSVSLRSTSSTASTQSFAFPILAQEWNSSPVRMAKPDKRQLVKQKSWKMKMGCLCCRF